jgi:GxxExxY protein
MIMKYGELTHDIIGCAMNVHSELGNGFQEVIYQRSLAIEMKNQGWEKSGIQKGRLLCRRYNYGGNKGCN